MKRSASLFAATLVFLVAPVVNAQGADLSASQREIIRNNCVNAQASMRQLQHSEAATRNNRGRAYESVSKLMAALNSRVALNKLNAPTLLTATNEMERRLTVFKNDYSAYYDKLAATIKLSCTEQPITFYDLLTSAREQRAKVAADIKAINEILDVYQTAVDDELRAAVIAGQAR